MDDDSEKLDDVQGEAKALKQLSFPEFDDDALPSSYAVKVCTCMNKWHLKMSQLSGKLDQNDPDMQERLGRRISWPTLCAKDHWHDRCSDADPEGLSHGDLQHQLRGDQNRWVDTSAARQNRSSASSD